MPGEIELFITLSYMFRFRIFLVRSGRIQFDMCDKSPCSEFLLIKNLIGRGNMFAHCLQHHILWVAYVNNDYDNIYFKASI